MGVRLQQWRGLVPLLRGGGYSLRIVPIWGITGPSWVSAGYPDWVTTTEQTDRDYASTGCAILYIYWMLSLGYTKAEVTQAGGATLADNYKTLTGKSTAYADLKAATQAVTVTLGQPVRHRRTNLMKRVAHNADGRLEVFGGHRQRALAHLADRPEQRAGPAGLRSAASSPAIRSGAQLRRPAGSVRPRHRQRAMAHLADRAERRAWSGWASLGGIITSDPAVVATDGRPLRCLPAAPTRPCGTSGRPRRTPGPGPAGHHWADHHQRAGGGVATPTAASRCLPAAPTTRCGTSGRPRRKRGPGPAGLLSAAIITSEPVVATTQTAAWRCSPAARTTRCGISGRPPRSNGWSGWASLGGIITSDRRGPQRRRPP